MQERKVWKLFNLLRNTEKQEVIRWLHFELGDRQQYIQKLYACMLQNPGMNGDMEGLWMNLYPDSEYDDARMRKLCRDLSRQLESYLAYQVLKKDVQKQEVAVLQALNQREASDLFLKYSRKLKRQSGSIQGKDATDFRYLYEIEVEIQRYLTKYLRNSREREKAFPRQYEHMLNCFDSWWAEEKLQLALGKSKAPIPHDAANPASQEFLLEELLEVLEKDEHFLVNDRLKVYLQVIKLVRGTSHDTELSLVINLIQETNSQWKEEELRNFLTSLINACIHRLNEKGDLEIALELFALFEWGIESRLFFIDQNLPEVVYKNLINICLRTKYFAQAKKYLEDFKDLLPEARQKECYRFNLGRYYFFTGAYKKLIATLAGEPFSNIFDEVDARTYLLQAQYEISSEEPEWIARRLGTLIRFVKYQKLPNPVKEAMINGFKLFKKLVLCYSSDEFAQVKDLIEQTKPLFRASWLLEKVEEKI